MSNADVKKTDLDISVPEPPTAEMVLFPWMYTDYWGQSWLLVACFHVAAILGVLSGVFSLANLGSMDGATLAVYAACFAMVGFARVAFGGYHLSKYVLREDDRFKWFDFNVRNVVLGVVIGVARLGISWVCMNLFYGAHPEFVGQSATSASSSLLLSLPAQILVLVLFAPLFEELVWRGVVFRGVLSLGAETWFVVLSQAILFAAFHFGFANNLTMLDLVSFWLLALFGVFLGVARWFTGSLVPGLTAHMLYNFGVVMLIVAA